MQARRSPLHALLPFTLTAAVALNAIGDPVVEAQNATATGEGFFGNASSVLKNLIEPLMTGAMMSNMNNSRTFSAQIGCRANSSFMELLIHPSASGDVENIQFQVDTNLDGTLDTVFNAPEHASGVCGNGYIACDAGTWTNCSGFQWGTDAAGMLVATPTSIQNLGACYCVNNHCGAGLSIMNMPTILQDLGGGAAAALSSRNPGYVITDTTVTPPIIAFSGQHTQGCSSGTTSVASYYSAPTTLAGAGAATAPANSVYNMITASPSATETRSTVHNCSIERQIHIDETVSNEPMQVRIASPGRTWLTVRFELLTGAWSLVAPTDGRDPYVVQMPPVLSNEELCGAGVELAFQGLATWPAAPMSNAFDSSVHVRVLQQPLCSNGLVGIVQVQDTNNSGNWDYFLSGRFDWNAQRLSCSLMPDNMVDSCGTYATDPECVLEEEVVDGVTTITAGVSTGFVPLAQTRNISGTYCTRTVTRDWFAKNRRYRCADGSRYDFTQGLERKAYIDANSTSATYADRRPDAAGALVESTGALPGEAMAELVSVPACTQVCKASFQQLANDASNTGVVLDNRVDTMTTKFVYHECSADGACPLAPGETEVKACGCLNEWAEAATIMQIMRMSGSDTICTSGTPAPNH